MESPLFSKSTHSWGALLFIMRILFQLLSFNLKELLIGLLIPSGVLVHLLGVGLSGE